MIAEMVSGERDWSDVLLLVAAILAVLAAVLARGTASVKASSYAIPLGFLAVAFLAFGLLLL